MTNQIEGAEEFARLHKKGAPLVLCNAWDAGSAAAVAKAGAPAIATGSWSVAAAQGYGDGQQLPLELLLQTARQIVQAVDLPVSVDFEGGYATAPAALAENIASLIDTGAVGLNFEDRIIGGTGLHAPEVQAARIAAIREAADRAGVPFFINARCDVFFQKNSAPHKDLMPEALARAAAYAEAGANGLFVPGLTDLSLVTEICARQPLPVNVMRPMEGPEITALAEAGVARISHGPAPYLAAMAALTGLAGSLAL